jgi:capsular polysaccharide biosynthesis protein
MNCIIAFILGAIFGIVVIGIILKILFDRTVKGWVREGEKGG